MKKKVLIILQLSWEIIVMGSRKKSEIRIKKKVNVRLKNCLKKKPAKKLNNFKTADVEVLLINCCLKKKKSSPAKKTKEVGIVLKKVRDFFSGQYLNRSSLERAAGGLPPFQIHCSDRYRSN